MKDTSFEIILERLLEGARAEFPELDTREGSLIFTALAPAALEMERLYAALNFALEMSYADTASREFLIRRANERGMAPIGASYAVIEAEMEPREVLPIPLGTRFRAGAVVYAVTGMSGEGYPLLTAETAGRIGNQARGSLVPISFVEGLQSARIRALAVPGRDEEETEAFRRRYMESHRVTGFGGNIRAYREKVLTIPGVGGVRIFPAYGGPGRVKVGIMDADLGVPSETLVAAVQELLDPRDVSGEGRGWAPIGHQVTAEGVVARHIAAETTLVLENGASPESVRVQAEAAVKTYFQELRAAWGQDETQTVRLSQIDTRLLDISGVLDVKNTSLDGGRGNLLLADMEIPMFHALTLR